MNLLGVQDPFQSAGEQIDTYRVPSLFQARKLWNRYRSLLYTSYVKDHEGDLARVRANPPKGFDQSDWQFILERRLLIENLKVS